MLDITVEGTFVYRHFIDAGGRSWQLRLDGGDYDRMPLSLSVVDDGLWTGQIPRRAVVVLPVRSRRSTRRVLGCS